MVSTERKCRDWATEHGCGVAIEPHTKCRGGDIYRIDAPDGHWLDNGIELLSSFNEWSWGDLWKRIQDEAPTVIIDTED